MPLDFKTSGAQTASTTGDTIRLPTAYKQAIFILDVTAAATASGDTLDVYVDFSPDGTSWINAIHFTQVLGNGGAKKELAKIDGQPLDVSDATISIASDASSGDVRNIGIFPYVRYRSSIVDADTDNASFTYSLQGYFQ